MTHPNEIILVNEDGTLTEEGTKIMFENVKDRGKREALKEQALRQEVYGVQSQQTKP